MIRRPSSSGRNCSSAGMPASRESGGPLVGGGVGAITIPGTCCSRTIHQQQVVPLERTRRASREAKGSQAVRRIISRARKGHAMRLAHFPPTPIHAQPSRASRGSQQRHWEYRDGSALCNISVRIFGARVWGGTLRFEAWRKLARVRK